MLVVVEEKEGECGPVIADVLPLIDFTSSFDAGESTKKSAKSSLLSLLVKSPLLPT